MANCCSGLTDTDTEKFNLNASRLREAVKFTSTEAEEVIKKTICSSWCESR